MSTIYTESSISRLYSNQYAAPIYTPPQGLHKHSFFEISFVRKGVVHNIINGERFIFQQGVCSILRPTDTHRFENIATKTSNYEHIDLYVSPKKFLNICEHLFPGLYESIIQNSKPIVFNISNEFIKSINNKINILLTQNAEQNILSSFHYSIITSLLTSYIEHHFISHHSYPSWLNTIISELNSIELLSLKISDISKKFGYTPEHLSREFKRYTGINLIDYITQQRIYYSISLLQNQDLKIIDIAFLLGYQKQSTFSTNFKKIMNCTPKEYQKKLKSTYLTPNITTQ